MSVIDSESLVTHRLQPKTGWAGCLEYLEQHCNPLPEFPPATVIYANVLWTLCECIGARTILEVGIGPTSVSGCTFLHSMGQRGGGTLISVDVDPNLPQSQYRDLAAEKHVFWLQHYGDSLQVADTLPKGLEGMVDLLYIDGHHDYAHAYGDTKAYLKFLRGGGYLVIDDSNFEGVKEAWAQLESEGFSFVQLSHEPPHGNGRLLWQKPR